MSNGMFTLTQIREVIGRLETSLTAFKAAEHALTLFTSGSRAARTTTTTGDWRSRPRKGTPRHHTKGLIMQVAPRMGARPFSVATIRRAISATVSSGRFITAPAVYTALGDLVKQKKLVRVGFGRYQVKG